MGLKPSGEMYLETIYVLIQKKSSVRSIDIAEYMSYTKPSVSRAGGQLKSEGYITIDSDNYITLTREGLCEAKKIYERHTVLTKVLMMLGIDEETASEDACRRNEEIIQAPKTPKSKRTITLHAEIMEMVKEYSSMLYDHKPTDRLFLTSKQSLTREMVRGCKLSGVKKIRIHDLRHSHASLLIELGFAPLLISERPGHENVETTLNTYSHLYPNKHGEVAEILSKLIQN